MKKVDKSLHETTTNKRLSNNILTLQSNRRKKKKRKQIFVSLGKVLRKMVRPIMSCAFLPTQSNNHSNLARRSNR